MTATAVGVVSAGLGWSIARILTAPARPRTFSLVVRGVERDGEQLRVVLDRTKDTEAVGIYNLWFERGGWVQLGAEIQDRGPQLLARTVTGASEGLVPEAGDRVSWSGIYFATPADAGLNAHEIMIETNAGPAPAWRVDGEPSMWAIHIHGLGSQPSSRHPPWRAPVDLRSAHHTPRARLAGARLGRSHQSKLQARGAS